MLDESSHSVAIYLHLRAPDRKEEGVAEGVKWGCLETVEGIGAVFINHEFAGGIYQD